MTKENRTIIRVQKGADNCQIHNCAAFISKDSDRSFVDTAAKNTQIRNMRVIEIGKEVLKKRGRIFLIITVLGFAADLVVLLTTSKHLWNYLFY